MKCLSSFTFDTHEQQKQVKMIKCIMFYSGCLEIFRGSSFCNHIHSCKPLYKLIDTTL